MKRHKTAPAMPSLFEAPAAATAYDTSTAAHAQAADTTLNEDTKAVITRAREKLDDLARAYAADHPGGLTGFASCFAYVDGNTVEFKMVNRKVAVVSFDEDGFAWAEWTHGLEWVRAVRGRSEVLPVANFHAIEAARDRLTKLGAVIVDDCNASEALVSGDTVRFFREQTCVATLTYTGTGHTGTWLVVSGNERRWETAEHLFDQPREAPAVDVATAAPVCPRCLGVEPGKPCGTPNDPHPGPFTTDLCAPCEAATTKVSVTAAFAPLSDKSESPRFTVDLARMTLLKLGAEIVNGCVGWVDGPTVCFAEQQFGTRLASVTYDDTGSWKASWIVRLPNGSIRNDTAEHKQEHPARKPDAAPSASTKAAADDLDDPATIAGEIVTELRGAIGEMEKLTEELSGKKTRPTLTLSITASLVAFLITEDPAAAPVRIVDALDEFLKRYPVSYDELYDIAVKMGSPPKEKSGDIGDRLAEALGRSNERAQHDLERLRQLHADVLGCPVEEVDARIAKQKAEESSAKAARSSGRKVRASARPSLRAKATKAEAKAVDEPAETPRDASVEDATAVVDDASSSNVGDDAADLAEAAPSNGVAMRKLTARQQELLSIIYVEDDRAIFGSDEHVEDWAALKQVMVALGGAWRKGSKKIKGGFIFEEGTDVAEVIRLAKSTGEILDPRLVGFVPTPAPLADLLVDWVDPQPGDVILEPEAGTGRIVEALVRSRASYDDPLTIACYELLETNREKLSDLAEDSDCDLKIIGDDFLQADPAKATVYDGCAMNPPFEKGADIKHVRHAIRFVKTGKRLAAIVSAGAMFRSDKAAVEFRKFVEQHGTIEALPDGSFTEEGTGVRTAIVRLTACPSCSLDPANHARPLF
jgi:hypothetical protein